MATKQTYNEFAAAPAPIAFIEVTKIIREEIPIQSRDGGLSYGQFLDEYLNNCVRDNQEVQTVTLNITPVGWQEFVMK